MPKYGVLVEGNNYLIQTDGKPTKLGFFTHRFVEAAAPRFAAEIALDLVRDELKGTVLNDETDTPLLRVDEMKLMDTFEGCLVPGRGFTFFSAEESSPWWRKLFGKR